MTDLLAAGVDKAYPGVTDLDCADPLAVRVNGVRLMDLVGRVESVNMTDPLGVRLAVDLVLTSVVECVNMTGLLDVGVSVACPTVDCVDMADLLGVGVSVA